MQVSSAPPSEPAPELSPRQRLLDAVVAVVTEKGYAQATIADVVRRARMSKRTFYELFADKEACFLAAYAHQSERLLTNIESAVRSEQDVEARLDAAARVYVATLEEQPALTRALLIEIQAVGPEARQLRRRIQGRFAEQLCVLVEAAREQRPDLASLSPPLATALVGGINELLLHTAEDGSAGDFSVVGKTFVELLRAVLAGGAAQAQAEGGAAR
jgi:AcrR family transcriptional regulator